MIRRCLHTTKSRLSIDHAHLARLGRRASFWESSTYLIASMCFFKYVSCALPLLLNNPFFFN
jgi:hypothetical protein